MRQMAGGKRDRQEKCLEIDNNCHNTHATMDAICIYMSNTCKMGIAAFYKNPAGLEGSTLVFLSKEHGCMGSSPTGAFFFPPITTFFSCSSLSIDSIVPHQGIASKATTQT